MKVKSFCILLLLMLACLPVSAKRHMLTRQQDTVYWHTPTWAWSLEASYAQPWLRLDTKSFSYLHGAQVGFRVDYNLNKPQGIGFSTGVRLQVANGQNTEYGPHTSPIGNFQQECVKYDMRLVNLIVPVQVRYDVRMYKDWHIYFFGGPLLDFGLAFRNKVENLLTDGSTCNPEDETDIWNTRALYAQYDAKSWSNMSTGTEGMYQNGRVWPFSLQMGVGGGIRWKCWALQGSYDFGLTNQSRISDHKDNPLKTWRWQVGVAYTF